MPGPPPHLATLVMKASCLGQHCAGPNGVEENGYSAVSRSANANGDSPKLATRFNQPGGIF